MWSRLLLCLVGTALFIGCSARKGRTKVTPTVDTEVKSGTTEAYLINNIDFLTFSGRAKTKVEFGTEKQDVTLHVRIQRDKAIWISVTATLFNYEAARIKITPDSIQVMNKMQSELISKPFAYIHKYTGPGVSFSALQDVLIGNVSHSLIRTDQVTVASAKDEVQVVGVKDNLAFQYSLNESHRPKVFRLNVLGSTDYLESFYTSFEQSNGYNFPKDQQIKLNAEGMIIDAVLNYTKFEFNQVIDMPFAIPPKYRIID